MHRRIKLPLLAFLSVVTTGCITFSWETEAVRHEVQSLRDEQTALQESLRAKETELTTMIASAREEVERLHNILTEATALLKRNNADVGAELEEARKEVNALRNELETAVFRFQKLEQDLQLTKEDIDLRFSSSEAAPEKNPDALFDQAKKQVTAGDFSTARRNLERFIKRNAKHPRYVEALFLKGQAYFGDKQWVNAIFAYRAIIEHHSGSSFVAEATFRIGQSFEAMGKCEEAKIFYDTVIQDHAGSKFKKKAAKAKQKLATGQCPAPL